MSRDRYDISRRPRTRLTPAAAGETLRPLFEGNALFGIGCSAQLQGGVVAVGDEVIVQEVGSRIIPARI